MIRGNPPYAALEVVGGVLWAIANAMAVIIIKMIGLGIGISTWYHSFYMFLLSLYMYCEI